LQTLYFQAQKSIAFCKFFKLNSVEKMSNPTQWYVKTKTGASGPYTTQQIKDFATSGKLPRQASISKTSEGPWTIANEVKGLFPEVVAAEESTQQQEDELQAGDYVPDVVKKSANILTSAVSGISKSLIAQVKRVETGISKQVSAATSSIDQLCAQGQDPAVVAKITDRVRELCTTSEEILYVAVQTKSIRNLTPDSVVLTNRRFIIFRQKLLGSMSFVDCPWKDCKDVHMEENIIGATLIFTGRSGQKESIDYIPKAQARLLYRHGQEQEELAVSTRRNMHLEELQAGADKTVINQAIGANSQQPPTVTSIDPVAKLTQLKQLLDAGIIDQSEFDAKKSELMKLI
jgi:hypothetical protein